MACVRPGRATQPDMAIAGRRGARSDKQSGWDGGDALGRLTSGSPGTRRGEAVTREKVAPVQNRWKRRPA
jgi:hypothetical protein